MHKHLSDIRREVKAALLGQKEQYPSEIHFCRGHGSQLYKITIEKIDSRTFVDDQGRTWERKD